INLYFASDTPDEIVDAVHTVITELSYLQTGQDLAVEISSEILGPDMLGMQIPPRDRMSPLFAILLVMIETIGLANLISEENEKRTIHALLVTPVSVKDIFISKGIIGVGLAFSQAVLFLAIVGGLNSGPLIILVALFLGAVLATGVAFLVASLAKDFMSVIGWSMPTFIILTIPAFGILFPGTISGWIKIIPSYYLADTVHQVARLGSGWSDVWHSLLILLGFDVVIICIGIIALGRKTR
ncbi:ABC transporter permease, partial [Chloroflexota bacterium]